MEFNTYKLKEITEIYNAKRIPLSTKQRSTQKNKKFPYYGAQGIIDYVEDYIFDGQYLLIAEDGENLRSRNENIALISTGKFWVNNHAHILKNNNKSNIHVLKHVLNTIDISGYLTGSAQPKLNKQNLESIQLRLPDIKIQNKIGNFIEMVEDKIHNNLNIVANLEQLSQTLFKHWFIDFEFPNEEGKPYKSSGGEMVESDLGEIPKEWSVGKAGDILEFSPKETISKNTLATFVEMKNLNTSAMVYDHIQKPFKSGSKFRNGDTLLARITPCLENGKIGFVDFLTEGEVGWGSTEFITIRTKNDIASSLSYYFASEQNFKNYAIKNMNGSSGRQRVKAETLSNYLIALPPKKLIKKFTDISEENMQMMTKLKEEILTLKQLRDTLLPKLLSGEIEIPDDLEV